MIRRLRDSAINMEECTLKQIYEFLIRDTLNNNDDNQTDDFLTSLKCEISSPGVDWKKTWRLVRSKGLGPELTSLTVTLLWGLIPTRACLNRILPLTHPSPSCQLCEEGPQETTLHALLSCMANHDLPARLLRTLRRYQPGAELSNLLTLDLEVEPTLELPFTWLVGSLLASIWKQREARRVDPVNTRAELEARCRLLRECRVKTWANASVLTEELVSQLFEN